MASSPNLKVYRRGEYIAACKYAEDAAAIVAMESEAEGDHACQGKADTFIKNGHSGSILWHEGHEGQPAGESYDFVARLVYMRLESIAENRRAAR